VTKTAAARPVEACLIDLFQHLGLGAAHIVAGRLGITDWQGLATRHADRIASLTLINPPILGAGQIRRSPPEGRRPICWHPPPWAQNHL